MSKFCVVGSLNIDLVTESARFPKPGETMQGKSFHTFTGGKGANQAVALGKLGADVTMIGKLGDDIYGKQYLSYFNEVGVKADGIMVETGSTGIAVITVADGGENSIIILAGANGKVDSGYVESKSDIIKNSDWLLLQLEIPIESVITAAKTAKTNNCGVILDPAPATKVPDELLSYVDIITPNETETGILTGVTPDSDESFFKAGRILTEKGVKAAVMKAGSRGAYIYKDGILTHVKGFKVEVTDTTAAGDTFNAGLAYGLGLGLELEGAVRFANAAAAIATTKMGAQSGMPSIDEVNKLLKT